MFGDFELDQHGHVRALEGKTLEFKRDLSSPTKPLRTIVAFANSAGGRLVIGVADDGAVVGVADPLTEEERITSLITDHISPQLVPAIDLVTINDATILVVDVPLSTRRPHFMVNQGPEHGVYVRLGSTTRQADPALVAELERNARGVSFEDMPEPRASLDDLNLEVLSKLRGRHTNIDDLVALGLAVKQTDKVIPTYAGILAACDDPTRFLPSAWVQCGRLRGATGTDIFDQIEIHGPMPLAVNQVMEFLLKHAYKSAEFGEVRRRDSYSIPVEAIREVVVNAVVHASYAERSTPIRVGFYDDRVQVESPGLLLPGMTIDSMRRASRLRNPSLARIFREAGIMEQWGTGVQRVYDEIAAAGLPVPRVEEVMDRLRFTVYVPSHAPEAHLSADTKHQDKAPRHQDKAPRHQDEAPRHQDEAPSQSVASLSARELVILQHVKVEPASRADLMGALGISNQTRAFRRHIEPLLEAGLLERTLPDKPTSRVQRYRITALGRTALARQEGTE